MHEFENEIMEIESAESESTTYVQQSNPYSPFLVTNPKEPGHTDEIIGAW